MDQAKSISVLLADDHPLIMTGFAMALADHGVAVVGQALTPEDAVEKYQALVPDVLVLDIRFGTTRTGFDAAKEVLSKFPNANIVFLSQFDQDTLIKESYRLGGRAFVTKGCNPEQLAVAIKAAVQGELYFLPEVARRLAQLAIRGDLSPQSLLDAREMEIFTLMAQGLTNAEIADKLKLSPKTISNTSQMVKEKLGIHRAADITLFAVKHGLIEP
jgi:DNA-binding NarL/FixJ family response regulator